MKKRSVVRNVILMVLAAGILMGLVACQQEPANAEVQAIQGEKGEPGADGQDGKDGKDGKDGLPGADGKDGQNGKNGLNGQDGAPGPQGEKGEKGDKGETGLGLVRYEASKLSTYAPGTLVVDDSGVVFIILPGASGNQKMNFADVYAKIEAIEQTAQLAKEDAARANQRLDNYNN